MTFKQAQERVKAVGMGWCFQRTNLTYRDAEKYELFNNNEPHRGTVAGYKTLKEADSDIGLLEMGFSPFNHEPLK